MDEAGQTTKAKRDTNENQFSCAEIELNLLREAEQKRERATQRFASMAVIC